LCAYTQIETIFLGIIILIEESACKGILK